MLLNFNKLSNFIQKSSDSYIKKYHIENGIVTLQLVLEDDSELSLEFKSNYLFISELSKIDIENTGILQCIKISNFINVEKGFYTFPKSFSDLMTIRKYNLTLAIGTLAKDYDYIINYYGYRNIISFLINSNELININER